MAQQLLVTELVIGAMDTISQNSPGNIGKKQVPLINSASLQWKVRQRKQWKNDTLPVFGVCFDLQKFLSVHPLSSAIPVGVYESLQSAAVWGEGEWRRSETLILKWCFLLLCLHYACRLQKIIELDKQMHLQDILYPEENIYLIWDISHHQDEDFIRVST